MFIDVRKMVVGLTFLTAVGCGKKNDDNEANEAKFTSADLVGLWTVDCIPSKFGQINAYRIAGLQISEAGNFIYEDTHYGDEKCTEKFYDESSKGSFQLGSSVDATGKRIAITGVESTGIPRQDSIATAANELGICGFKNWVKDQPQNLLNTGCIGWSETNNSDGISLVDTGEGKKQIQVFGLSSSGAKQIAAGDVFTKE